MFILKLILKTVESMLLITSVPKQIKNSIRLGLKFKNCRHVTKNDKSDKCYFTPVAPADSLLCCCGLMHASSLYAVYAPLSLSLSVSVFNN